MSCNPSRNWVYNEYYKKSLDGTLEPYKCFVPALSTDNEFITKHYITSLERQDEVTKRRLLYGQWDYEDQLGLFKYDNLLDMFDDDPMNLITTNSGKIISIDVARLGKDKTCIIIWDHLNIIEVKELSRKRLDEQANIIREIMTKYNITNNKQLIFDTDGVGGGLADMFNGCVEIVNNSRPVNEENYQNLKTQLYYKLSEQINLGNIKIYNVNGDQKTRILQELQIIKRENADQDGKIKMTNKEQIKIQIGRSPDLSDSMAFRMIKLLKKSGGTDFGISFVEF
jgi:hypothetical protein